MNEEIMKKIGKQMGIRMGLLMSFSLALIGTLTSGHFTIPSFLISFVISTVISVIIGFVVPVGKVSADACRKHNLPPESLKGRLLQSLISDLVYTPIMTLIMVGFAYFMLTKSGAESAPPFIMMFLKSFVICMIAGYILIFIFMPLFLKQLLKKAGVSER
ncbi:MAG: hypothetical protein IKT17_06205 [Lachnospiraceae bacterium]|nr:hypothetical protein [Lachnospiraceae bacterium]